MLSKSDSILVEESRRGSRRAFRELYERYEHPLFNFIRRYTGSIELAQDLLQETFIRVWYSAHSFDTRKGNFKGWVYKIALNITRNEMNRKQYSCHFQDVDRVAHKMVDPDDNPHNIIEKSDASRTIEKALNDLQPILKEIVIMKNFQQLKFREISEITEIPEGTLKARYHRAVKELKKQLKHLEF